MRMNARTTTYCFFDIFLCYLVNGKAKPKGKSQGKREKRMGMVGMFPSLCFISTLRPQMEATPGELTLVVQFGEQTYVPEATLVPIYIFFFLLTFGLASSLEVVVDADGDLAELQGLLFSLTSLPPNRQHLSPSCPVRRHYFTLGFHLLTLSNLLRAGRNNTPGSPLRGCTPAPSS